MKRDYKGTDRKNLDNSRDSRIIRFAKKIRKLREFNICLILISVCLLISLFSEYFLKTENLMGIAKSFSTTAIMALGMTMVIVVGGIDLSVGSVVGLSAIMTAFGFENGYPAFVCVLIGLAMGFLVGVSNGLLIAKIKLQPFIATLGTMNIGRGLIYIMTEGTPKTPDLPKGFIFFGQGYLGVVPMPVVILAVLTIIFTIIMTMTRFGRHVYAIGGNELASRLSGVKTDKTKITVYSLSGILSAVAGIVLYSRLTSAEASAGFGSETDVIAAAVIGGASMAGGAGSIVGAVIGAALIGVIQNGIVLLSINTYAQQVIIGMVILVAISLDTLRKKHR